MKYIGDKYAGISTVNLKNKSISYFINYKDENNVARRIKVGTTADGVTKSKALSILNEKKLEVKILKDKLENGESLSKNILEKKKKYFTTLNEVADYYFLNNNSKKSMKDELTKYNYHFRDSDLAKMNINLITKSDLDNFYNEKKIQRADGRRAGKEKLDIRYRERAEIDVNDAECSFNGDSTTILCNSTLISIKNILEITQYNMQLFSSEKFYGYTMNIGDTRTLSRSISNDLKSSSTKSKNNNMSKSLDSSSNFSNKISEKATTSMSVGKFLD